MIQFIQSQLFTLFNNCVAVVDIMIGDVKVHFENARILDQ